MRVRWVRVLTPVLLALTVGVVSAPVATAHPGGGPGRPTSIDLPAGFQPEGISSTGSTFFVGSRTDGAIYRGSLRTGEGAVLVPGTTGGFAAGTEVDSRQRLWVAGGSTGLGTVYDTRTGAELARYTFDGSGAAFINDVVVTERAAYFTDSRFPVVYVVALTGRSLPDSFSALPLTGAVQVVPGATNLNGIETTPDGKGLLVVQSNAGLLFRLDPRTGVTTPVDLGGVDVLNGDGLLRQGRTLYVVQNRLNRIAEFRLSRTGDRGELVRTITSPQFDVPTTVTRSGGSLWAVNARFGVESPLTAGYTVVPVPR
ncbi:hypothetical protein JL107_02005 [Nakamurella flavida]|uniref:Superoxide dismutase n=1 Tax=Nakamurella flavida TaxID=363630 RepID=A0A938YLP7_9ACTN|nr:hypothetical protein [Nakamurella flavida]MBM9475210.1 hypothetical protein [Nakamurella flavida]MDP9776783.1 sugar lactone lactonase YvrE [Nakamurella flavida]